MKIMDDSRIESVDKIRGQNKVKFSMMSRDRIQNPNNTIAIAAESRLDS